MHEKGPSQPHAPQDDVIPVEKAGTPNPEILSHFDRVRGSGQVLRSMGRALTSGEIGEYAGRVNALSPEDQIELAKSFAPGDRSSPTQWQNVQSEEALLSALKGSDFAQEYHRLGEVRKLKSSVGSLLTGHSSEERINPRNLERVKALSPQDQEEVAVAVAEDVPPAEEGSGLVERFLNLYMSTKGTPFGTKFTERLREKGYKWE